MYVGSVRLSDKAAQSPAISLKKMAPNHSALLAPYEADDHHTTYSINKGLLLFELYNSVLNVMYL